LISSITILPAFSKNKRIIPWVRRNPDDSGITAIAGPEAMTIYSPIPLHEKKSFILYCYPSHIAHINTGMGYKLPKT
jgi:hypothetical protein